MAAKKSKPIKKSVTKAEASKELKSKATKITDADFKTVVNKGEELTKLFKTKIPLKEYIEDFKVLFSLVVDFWNKKYRDISYWSVAIIVAALIYVLAPVDLIPDFIPVAGFLDDATVIGFCLQVVRAELKQYIEWKKNRG